VPLHGGTFKQESLIGVAKYMRSKTGYEILGDIPWYLAAAAIAVMSFVKRRGAAA
jgi:apolipoprotein N-acyltransferase